MKKARHAILGVILCFTLLFSSAVTPLALALEPASGSTRSADAAPSSANIADVTYTIYPLPREINYEDTGVAIPKTVNIVYGDSIDSYTKNHMAEALGCLRPAPTVTVSDAAQEGALNVLVGVRGSGDAADTALADLNADMTITSGGTTATEDIFTSQMAHDAYMIRVTDSAIAVVGRNTDAAFYGVTTLQHIFSEMAQREMDTLRKFTLRDYASVAYRGFIEGYYGLPWTNENRQSLMEWGGQWKMNGYVFAPKNDPYHKDKWRNLYPEAELQAVAKLADTGNRTKCRYIYALHCFGGEGGGVRFDDNYATDFKIITDKFQQLYDVGVRQFAILGDDVGGIDPTYIARLMNDLNKWRKDKGDIYELFFCPPDYNASWAGDGHTLDGINTAMDDDVQLFWTGNGVCGHATAGDANSFKDLVARHTGNGTKEGRTPLMWLNWPVNDINGHRLVMGPGSNEGGAAGYGADVAVLKKGEADYFSGIISNPMMQAQLDRTPLFAVADFSWNDDDYNGQQSWADGFQYLDPDAGDALHEISKHLSDPAPNGHAMDCGESEDLKPLLDAFLSDYQAGKSIVEQADQLAAEFQKIVQACDDIAALSKNEGLLRELEAHRLSLREICESGKAFVQTAAALEEKNAQDVWSYYSLGTAQQAKSKTHLTNNILAEAGSKRIMPFVQTMSALLADPVQRTIDPTFGDKQSIKFYFSAGMNCDEGKMEYATDRNPKTVAYSHYGMPKDSYFGVSYQAPVTISQFRVLTGPLNNPTNDCVHHAVLEYRTADSDTYLPVPDGSNGEFTVGDKIWDFTASPLENVVDMRVRHLEGYNQWMCVREIGRYDPKIPDAVEEPPLVNKAKYHATPFVMQGMSINSELTGMTDDNDATFAHIHHEGNNSMQPDEFIGIDLGEAKPIVRVRVLQGAGGNGTDIMSNAVLEYSSNNVEYTTLKSGINENKTEIDCAGAPITARYLRLRNTTATDRWSAVSDFSVEGPYSPLFTSEHVGFISGDASAILDDNNDSGASFATVPYNSSDGGNSIGANEFVGIELPKQIRLGRIHILQGNNDQDSDKLTNATLEYSVDGTTYTPIMTNINDNVIDVDLTSSGIRAEYVRLRNGDAPTGRWLALRTFTATESKSTDKVYTNAANCADTYCTIAAETATIGVVANDITLQPNEYFGIKLPRIRELDSVIAQSVAGLELQAGCNPLEMKPIDSVSTDHTVNARYVYLKNTSAAPIKFAFTGMKLHSNEIQPIALTENTMGGYDQPDHNITQAFDGNLGTQMVLADQQNPGAHIVIDLAQERKIDSLQIVSGDSEWDYIHYAKVEASLDGTTWQDLITLGGEADPAQPDPSIIGAPGWTHTISYCYTGSKPGDAPFGVTARYLRITQLIPEHLGKWTRVNEIAINSMISGNDYIPAYVQESNNPTFSGANCLRSHAPENLADGDVSTTYRTQDTTGSMLYRLSENLDENHILSILQSPATLSGAKVSVRPANTQTFTQLGNLNYSMNEFSLSAFPAIAEIRLEWDGIAPEIHEILLGKKTPAAVDKTQLRTALADAAEFEKTPAFASGTVARKQKYAAALAQAKAAEQNAQMLQSGIDQATRVLSDAVAALKNPQFDKTKALSLTDPATGISLAAAAGVLPNITVLHVTPITAEGLFTVAQTALGSTASKFSVYDILAQVEGSAMSPDGIVTVSIPIPADYAAAQLRLCEIDGSGTLRDIAFTTANEKMVFTTDHLSNQTAFVISEKVVPPSGGSTGGSGSQPSTTTTTVTTDNGNKITTVVDKNSGTTTVTAVTPDGTTARTVTDKNGKTEVTVTVSEKTVSGSKDGVLALPVVGVDAAKGGAASIAITLPKTEGSTKVAIPVGNLTSGTIAVRVNPDGTEEIIRNALAKDGSLIVSLSGSCTVKIRDNSKAFQDVTPNAWCADAVQFVTSRELFRGTGDNTFDTDAAMSRGMLATVLYRFANEPKSTKPADFGDVPAGTYYTDAVAWASENNIVTGNGKKFDPNGEITREQLAVMLYRFAGSPAEAASLDSFADGASVSDWAKPAMIWAAQQKIISGTSHNQLAPQASATRAEVAVILARFAAI